MHLKKFTLVELIVIIAILAALFTLITPSLGRMMKKSRMISCKVNLKEIHQMVCLYTEDHGGSLPGPTSNFLWPRFNMEISYDRDGLLRRRNQRLSSYLRVYTEPIYIDRDFSYLEQLICPANAEEDYLSQYKYSRPTYHIQRVNHHNMFGITESEIRGQGYREMELPHKIQEIENLSSSIMMKDVIDKEKTQRILPDYPVHLDHLENMLYYDGHTESQPYFDNL